MELIKSARRHSSWLSEAVYILLNLALAVAVFAFIYLGLVVLAYLIVVLSKWRVFAVRPRYWWDNIQANFLDVLFGISVVSLLWQASSLESSQMIVVQLTIVAVYSLWLIVLKPMTGKVATLAQSLAAQFFAISALFSVAYVLPSWVVVASMWLIGYIAARHVFNAYEEEDITLMSLVWGFVVAELGWIAFHWTVAYSLIFTGSAFQIPQVAIIVSLLGYFALKSYSLHKEKKKLRLSDILGPAIFAGGIIITILLLFNGYQSNIT